MSDVVMPDMSGVELAELLRRERPGLPVLLVSRLDARDRHRAAAAGRPFLQKPFTLEALARAVRGQLDAHKACDRGPGEASTARRPV